MFFLTVGFIFLLLIGIYTYKANLNDYYEPKRVEPVDINMNAIKRCINPPAEYVWYDPIENELFTALISDQEFTLGRYVYIGEL